jgi:hypothetical protein
MRTTMLAVAISMLGACAARPSMSGGGGDDSGDDGGGDDGSDMQPTPTPLTAADDALAVEMDGSATVEVLANDLGVIDGRTLAIAIAPEHGTATLADDGTLAYATAGDYLGSDAVQYAITNPDGTTATAAVAISVSCETCALGTPITLAWDPATDASILGFRLYMGATDDATQMMMVDDISITRPGFDPSAPSATYDAWLNLHLRLGATVCFRMTDYNSDAESDFSNAACATVTSQPMSFST